MTSAGKTEGTSDLPERLPLGDQLFRPGHALVQDVFVRCRFESVRKHSEEVSRTKMDEVSQIEKIYETIQICMNKIFDLVGPDGGEPLICSVLGLINRKTGRKIGNECQGQRLPIQSARWTSLHHLRGHAFQQSGYMRVVYDDLRGNHTASGGPLVT